MTHRLLTTMTLVLATYAAAAVSSCSSSLPVDSVSVTGEQRIPTGATTQLTAVASTVHGRVVHDVTAAAKWTSSDPSIASVSAGLVQALRSGDVTIRAEADGASGTIGVTVTGATLTAIDVGPAVTVPKGVGKRLTATGTFSDLSTRDLTTSVRWSSTAPEVATVSNDPGSIGLLTGVAAGEATVTATDPATGVAGSAVVTVSSAQLVSIAITPDRPSVPLGVEQQFTAVGTFSDATTQDLTASVKWSALPVDVVTFSDTGAAGGLATAVRTGTTTISATESSSGISSSTVVTVTAARLASLAVTPPSPSIALGASQQFTATGTYTDATTRDLTATVTWQSSSTAVAQVSNTGGTNGLATSTGPGSTTLKATDPASGVSATATLTVTAAQLVSISVTPAAPSTPLGLTTQFTATGTYTDGTRQDLTATVAWGQSNASVAVVSTATATRGLATTLSPGTTTITATAPASGISGSATLTVTAAELVSVAVTPASAAVPLGLQQQFRAAGTYTDGTQHDITATVTWSSADATVASISNVAGSAGLASTAGPGQTAITAAAPNTSIKGSATLQVTAALLVSIAVTPSTPSVGAGQTQQFTATGTYTDASTHDLTATVTWTTSDPGVATISNAAGSNGLATAAAVAAASATTITAEAPATTPPITGTATLAVTP